MLRIKVISFVEDFTVTLICQGFGQPLKAYIVRLTDETKPTLLLLGNFVVFAELTRF